MDMRILVFEPENTRPKIQHISGTTESMQQIVDGYIEPIYVPDVHHNAVLLVNDEGLLRGLTPNRIVDGRRLVGTFLLCKQVGKNLVGLTFKEATELQDECSKWPLADHA